MNHHDKKINNNSQEHINPLAWIKLLESLGLLPGDIYRRTLYTTRYPCRHNPTIRALCGGIKFQPIQILLCPLLPPPFHRHFEKGADKNNIMFEYQS